MQEAAARWVADALARLRPPGRLVVVDYTSSTAAMAARPWREWLRTYRDHQRGGHYLADPGVQDITADVALDQLAAGRPRPSTQAEFLRRYGLEELVEEGRRIWAAHAARARPRRADRPQPGARGRGADRPGRPRRLHRRRVAGRLRPHPFASAPATAECTDRGHERLTGVGTRFRPSAPHTQGVPNMADEPTQAIDDLLLENRTFPPPEGFKEASLVAGTFLYDEADEDYQGFWARQAAELLDWSEEWHTICEWELPFAKWFVGGQLNVAYNCLDRHVDAGRGDKVAFYWEGEPGDSRVITYAELLDEVQRFANVLKGLGVERGDRVNIYLPMIPEAVVAMLACARIGAPHSVVFGGFSSAALADRINDAEAKVLITADGGYRRGEVFPLKPQADVALEAHAEHRAASSWSGGGDNPVEMTRRAATTGTTSSWPAPMPSARPSRWTPSSCSTSSTPRARPASPRASCTRPAAT